MGRDLIAVVGPTCTGKGTLALALADALGGPARAAIVACDSVKIYRGADIGTAKIPAANRRGYDFFMLDVAAPGEVYSAGRYMVAAREACETIWAGGKTAIIAGGTGLYFRALLDGICAAPPANPAARAALRARADSGEDLHATLERVDPTAAAAIQPGDRTRIIRALEVFETTGLPISGFRAEEAAPLCRDRALILILDGPRPWLAERIDRRTAAIVAMGLGAETEKLRALTASATAPPLNAIGYRHIIAVREGRLAEDELIPTIAGDTRRLAKRQRTWFRREERGVRLDASRETPALIESFQGLWKGALPS